MTLLEKFWPDNNQVDECLQINAEGLAEEVLLNVHVPTNIRRQKFQEGVVVSEDIVSENELFQSFMELNTIIPLLGSSGSGKSHIIRWIRARLNQEKNASEKYKIITIPKSIDVTEVIERLFEDIPDAKEFVKAARSHNQMSDEGAVSQLLTHMHSALEVEHSRLDDLRTDNGGGALSDANEEFLSHLQAGLKYLFFDGQVKTEFE